MPSPVRARIPLVAIDSHRPREIERLFGVRQVGHDDYAIEIDDATLFHSWSTEADNRLRRVIPYLYAYRLSRIADETGRESSLLNAVHLSICQKVQTSVSVLGGATETDVIEHDLGGLAIRRSRQLFLVSSSTSMSDDIVLWRAVGELLADLIDVAGAGADFGQLLACGGSAQMKRLLDLMTDGRGEELVTEARSRLHLQFDEPSIFCIPPPVPATDRQTIETQTTNEANDGSPVDQSANQSLIPLDVRATHHSTTFAPIEPPERGQPGRRRIVVVKKVEFDQPSTRVTRVPQIYRSRSPRNTSAQRAGFHYVWNMFMVLTLWLRSGECGHGRSL